MEKANGIGIDLPKNSFRAHGARADGSMPLQAFTRRHEAPGRGAKQPPGNLAASHSRPKFGRGNPAATTG